MLVFNVFDITDTEAVLKDSIEIDPADSKSSDEIKYLFELRKTKKVYVQATDGDSAHFLAKPIPRGRAPLTHDVIIFMHELLVEQKQTPIQIMYKVYEKFGEDITANQLKDILSQKKYTDVPGIDHLRQRAADMMPKKPDRRRKITKEVEAEMFEMFENGMTGNAISKELNISSPSVNTRLRAKYGPRKHNKVATEVKEEN